MQKILMIFYEPTPYIMGLITTICKQWIEQIDIIFLTENHSQNWVLDINDDLIILKGNRRQRIKKLYKQIIENHYNAIFLAGWGNIEALSIFGFAKWFGIPLLVDSDTPLLPHIPRWKRGIKHLIYPWLFKIPDMFLPAGTRQANYLKHYKVPDNKITLEKMTVDVVEIQRHIQALPENARYQLREEFGFAEDDFICLFVGRLIERKGIQELLQAFKQINNPKIKLAIIGDGPLNIEVTLATTINKNVRYLGWLKNEALINVYFMSDVLVLPAHWEPWGLVVNEAMAAGKPVIASSEVGCVDDLVISGKTGLLVEPKCETSLQEAILYLHNNSEIYQSMVRSSLALIAEWTLAHEAQQIKYALNVAGQTKYEKSLFDRHTNNSSSVD